MKDDMDPDDLGPPVTDSLREMLYPEPEALLPSAVDIPPGSCPIHGNVGFARFLMIDGNELVSDHCVRCLSRIFVALVGVLEMPE